MGVLRLSSLSALDPSTPLLARMRLVLVATVLCAAIASVAGNKPCVMKDTYLFGMGDGGIVPFSSEIMWWDQQVYLIKECHRRCVEDPWPCEGWTFTKKESIITEPGMEMPFCHIYSRVDKERKINGPSVLGKGIVSGYKNNCEDRSKVA